MADIFYPNKILIIQTAFLGDVILTTSLIEKLNEKFPDSSIDFLLRKGNQVILKNNPHINEVLILDKKKKASDSYRLIKILRKNKYDLLVNAQRYFTTGFITCLSGAKIKIGYADNPLSFLFTKRIGYNSAMDSGQHELDKLHRLIADYTDDKAAMPRIYIGKTEEDKISSLPGDFITIHPGSVWFTKQFPRERWIEFLNKVPEDLRIFLLGGPRERVLCDSIKDGTQHEKVENMAGDLDLIESAALMKRAKNNYVNDSAPLHICSAVGAPCTAIFCSTVPEFGFGPLSPKSRIIEIEEKLDCRPCGRHGKKKCPEGHFKCAMNIPVESLLDGLG